MVKVSVVVPTYRSGDGLDRLVRSLDAQTMSPSEFEVIFVDDGSPDDTHERLLRIQAERRNVRVERIENSGWPCRPRNIGTDMARGEYVAYMDHDDLLYPDALRGAYEFAKLHGADVVNGKEARTHDAEWAMDTYVADVGNSRGREDQHPLIPMNPHKLYRRAFLNEHGIRFREGGKVYWEDIFFNVKVARYASVISTLSSVPYYHWYSTPGSGSAGFLKSDPAWWAWLREVIVAIEEDLGDEAHALERRQLLAHQYRARVLASFDGKFTGRAEDVKKMIFDECRAVQAEHLPAELDTFLNAGQRLRAHLLRTGRQDLLEELPSVDPGIPGRGHVDAAVFRDGVLHVDATARWVSGAGRTHALRRVGDRIVKELPERFLEAAPDGSADVTDEILGATARLGLRSRASRVSWLVPSEGELRVHDAADGGVSFDVVFSGSVDPATAAFGRPLDAGVWDLSSRCALAGTSQQLRIGAATDPIASTDGTRLLIAYTNADGFLSLDIGQTVKKAPIVLAARTADAVVRTRDDRLSVRVPLEGIEVRGTGRLTTRVQVSPATAPKPSLLQRLLRRPAGKDTTVPGTIECVDAHATLAFTLPEGWDGAWVHLGTERSDSTGPWPVGRADSRRP